MLLKKVSPTRNMLDHRKNGDLEDTADARICTSNRIHGFELHNTGNFNIYNLNRKSRNSFGIGTQHKIFIA